MGYVVTSPFQIRSTIFRSSWTRTFQATSYDIPSTQESGLTVGAKWDEDTGTYWWIGIPNSTYQDTKKTSASEVKDSTEEESGHGGVKARVDAGQGLMFESLSCSDDPDCETEQCKDPNRKTKADGSCDSDCKDGYEYVGIDGEDYPTSMCVDDPMNYDPNDCASKNRHTVADYECGECKGREYVEDAAGNCVLQEQDFDLETHLKEYGMYYGIGLFALLLI